MNFLTKNRKWLLASALVLVASLLGVWLNNGSASGNAIPTLEQKNQGITSPPITEIDALAPVLVTEQNSFHQNPTATETLPPIPAEMATEIRQLSNRTFDGLTEEKQADGSVSVDLQGHFQSVTAAVRGPDGKIIIRHGEDFLTNIQPDTTVDNNDKNN